tara:strand:- start:2759 stop:3013 length:255 start_codon:yes stop_codon:yes gene_type:complete
MAKFKKAKQSSDAKDKDTLEMEGNIVEVLPNQMFKVKIPQSVNEIVCYTGGKMRQNRIRLVQGDQVRIAMTPYDLTKGRIIFRL